MSHAHLEAARRFNKRPDGLKILGVFPGTNPDVTPEEVHAELNRAVARLEAGDFEAVNVDETID